MRADEQEPDRRPGVVGEEADDDEAISIKPTAGKCAGSALRAVELTSADLPGLSRVTRGCSGGLCIQVILAAFLSFSTLYDSVCQVQWR